MKYYLNIGTNLGDRRENLRRAIEALTGDATSWVVSPVVESEPWGFESENRFLNIGLALDSDLEPLAMLDRIHDIERQLGSAAHRDAQGGYVDRLVDIDIMAIDDAQGRPMTIDLPTLQVPHPHLYDREFFLKPYQWLREARSKKQETGFPLATLDEAVLAELPFEPTDEQVELVAMLDRFVEHGGDRTAMLLMGYAGTGKTSIVGALVRALRGRLRKCVLMAPTGRAAHIMTDYSGHPAWTIHRKIYRQQSYGSDTFGLADNKHTDTLFIVDEASMIANGTSDGAIFGTGRLLDDLITYVYSGEGCRLLLVGDTAQLPPVGTIESPALNPQVLQGYGLQVMGMMLRQTARQAQESGILHNATLLRNALINAQCTMLNAQCTLPEPQLELEGFGDIKTVTGDMLLETLSNCYDRDGMDQTIIITRSNWRATQFNGGVRGQILYREEELASGDLLLVAKNNYYWAEEYEEVDFIANGDVAVVRRVRGEVERRYGLRFATVVIELPDHNHTEMEVKVVLDCLLSDTPALTHDQQERLFNEVMSELPGDQRNRYRELKRHPYFNALQVKMAYAVTCHKAQGGQWRNVFIDMGGIVREALTTLDFYRWLYTALTRATQHVYLINYVPLAP